MRRMCLPGIPVISLLLLSAHNSFALRAGIDTTAFVTDQILSRPTDTSITLTIVPTDTVQLYCEYGAERLVYPHRSDTVTVAPRVPARIVMDDLVPDTRYYYRMRYKGINENQFRSGDERTFCTQRARGRTFTFTIEADPHPYDKKGSRTLWKIALQNQLKDSADFLVDLGDTFGDDHNPFTITSEEIRQLHLECRSFFGIACHSSPLFLCLGNHEGESGYYLLQTPPNNLGVYGTRWRHFYYANPVPNGFYSGNTAAEEFGIGLPENYYAWEWGDALFVVLDAYRGYTSSAKPRGWDWTLGQDQYDWFKRTLETSTAKFKFVVAHHTLGETRGGATTARLFEWGGYEANGTTWGFAANRPGWAMPIHQLMVANGVNIFFQGHDHLFAKEDVDGVVYQEVPMPSDSTYIIGVRDNGDAYTGVTLDGSGHLRITVSSFHVTVEYVRAWLPANETADHTNGEVAYTYTVFPVATPAELNSTLPAESILEQNYPNPFNPTTTIEFRVGGWGQSPVRLSVYDVLGREVVLLVSERMDAGTHRVSWDASHLPAGVYFYRLHVNGSVDTRTAVLLK
jgi:hypothetical protein